MKIDVLLKLLAWERAYKEHGNVMNIAGLFQDLIDDGEIKDMGQAYQDIADRLMNAGICNRPKLRIIK